MCGDRVPGPFSDAVDRRDRERRETRERHREGCAKTIERALAEARASYTAEFLQLDEIALGVFHGKRGSFVRKYTDAWLHADMGNKRLMRPVFEAFIRKYDLEADPTGTGAGPSEPRENP